MLKKIAKYSLYLVVLASFATLLSFAINRNNTRPIGGLEIQITDSACCKFINKKQLHTQVLSVYDSIFRMRKSNIDLALLEKKISALGSVRTAQAYIDVDSDLQLKVEQRKPLARIITESKEFYIDQDNRIMPLSDNYTANVTLVFTQMKNFNKNDIYQLVSKINENEFLKMQLVTLSVGDNNKITFETKKGSHYIEFGKCVDIEEKLNKLLIFYKNTVSEFGWDRYEKINIEFANQVVCTKKIDHGTF